MIVRVKEFKGYGLLYYLDDEDEVYSDEFRVLVSKKGKCGWKRDENFSPCIQRAIVKRAGGSRKKNGMS